MRYPHYGYLHVYGDECHVADRCSACNRSNRTSVIAFLSGSEYDPNRVSECDILFSGAPLPGMYLRLRVT